MFNDLSVGILSWGSHATLRNTLESYKQYGLLEQAAQFFIFFQEISEEDISIATDYSIDIYGSHSNLGIAGGYRAMLDIITKSYYLFLENDWELKVENAEEQLRQGLYLLDNSTDFIKYRSRLYPGNPLWSRQWAGGQELAHPEHLLDCLHWRTDESINKNFSEYLKFMGNGWYRTTSQYGNWTNNPHLVRMDWLKKNIVPKVGNKDIERDIQSWWRKQEFIVAQGDGMFTHYRLDR
jgi:hypothetical protein